MPKRSPAQQAWFDRHEVVTTWLTVADFDEFRRQALAAGLTVSTHARNVLVASLKDGRKKTPVSSGER